MMKRIGRGLKCDKSPLLDHTFKYKQVQISRSDIRPHIKWAVSLVILHMVTSIFLWALCGYVWVNILTLSPRGSILVNALCEAHPYQKKLLMNIAAKICTAHCRIACGSMWPSG